MAPSAASRVFAIRELLERILLDDTVGTQGLFVLQCVNRRFRQMIARSFRFSSRMHLHHLTEEEVAERLRDPDPPRDPLKHSAANPYLEGLSLYPFTVHPTAAVSYSMTVYNLLVTTHISSLEVARKENYQLGYKGLEGQHRAGGSWGAMMLSPLPVRVEVHIDTLDSTRARSSRYSETVTLQPEEATLGNLIEILEEVWRRDPEEHQELMQVGSLMPRRFRESWAQQSLPQEGEHSTDQAVFADAYEEWEPDHELSLDEAVFADAYEFLDRQEAAAVASGIHSDTLADLASLQI